MNLLESLSLKYHLPDGCKLMCQIRKSGQRWAPSAKDAAPGFTARPRQVEKWNRVVAREGLSLPGAQSKVQAMPSSDG